MWDLCALAVYVSVTLAMTWPLVLRLADGVPKDLGDPLFSTWAIWWNAQVLPFTDAWWHAPIFYPAGNAMALADHRVGLGVITTPLIWAGASPLVAYNVAFLGSFFLSAAAGYALALAVTGHRPAAFVGGLVFGFHPFRAAHLEHVELLSSVLAGGGVAVPAPLGAHPQSLAAGRAGPGAHAPGADVRLLLLLRLVADRRLDRLVRTPPIVVVAAGRAGGGAGGAGAGDRPGTCGATGRRMPSSGWRDPSTKSSS